MVSAGTSLSQLQPGTLLKLPASDPQAAPSSAAIAASDARRSRHGPHKGIVAVKVQYPNAYPTMALDLGNVKTAAAFLQKTELKFDLTSAVKELAKQIKLEFDFSREAKIMDDISSQLQVPALNGTASVGLDRQHPVSCVASKCSSCTLQLQLCMLERHVVIAFAAEGYLTAQSCLKFQHASHDPS